MTLSDFLAGILSGTLTVPAVKAIFDWGLLKATKFNKVVASFVLPFLLSIAAWLAMVQLGYTESPTTVEMWWGALYPIAVTAYTVGQALYHSLGGVDESEGKVRNGEKRTSGSGDEGK